MEVLLVGGQTLQSRVKEFISGCGNECRFHVCASTKEALAVLGERKIDLLILDPANPSLDLSVLVPRAGTENSFTRVKQDDSDNDARFGRIADSMRDIIIEVDMTEKILYVSPSVKHILGYDVDYMLGKNVGHFIHPEDINLVLIKDLSGSKFPINLEIRVRHLSGHYVWMEILGNLLVDEHGKPGGAVFVSRDITERKKREEEYLKASKLESVGILASGIAHDFNNILAIILSNIFLARLYLGDRNRMLEKLKEVEKAVVQAKNLSSQLLSFARGGDPVKKAVYVGSLVKEAASLVLCGSSATYELTGTGEQYIVEVDEALINQVINNIMINALQAMPGGGTIRIKVDKVECGPEGLAEIPLMSAGSYIKISIADQGTGINEADLPKIFDPFFTTKPEGSGLGLAISYSAIAKHGGYISVDSQLGQGTTFHIYLPEYHGEPPSKPRQEQSIVVGRGRILIMDDNETLVEIICDLLAELGYQTAAAKDGEEAIKLYKDGRESGRPFDLVIMDLTIPGRMGAKEAIKKLQEYDPEAKVLITTGYSNNQLVEEYERYGFMGFIAKPYQIEDLAREINRVINIKR